MAFTELLKSIIESSKDRIKKPIAGAFLLSFIFYNRAPILYFIFSKSEVEDKLQVLSAIFKLDFLSFGIPLLIAVIYVLGLPYLTYFLNKILNHQKIGSLDLIYDVKDRKAKREKDLQNLIAGNKEIQDLNEQIKNLTDENTNLKDSINLKDKEHNEIVRKLNSKINNFNNINNKEIVKEDLLKRESIRSGFTESEFYHYRFLSSILNKEDINVLKMVFDRKENGLSSTVNNNEQIKKLFDNNLIETSGSGRSYITDFGRNFLKLYEINDLL